MRLSELYTSIVDLFYPDICAGCGQALVRHEDSICLSCLWDLPYTGMHDIEDNMIEQRLWGKLDFEQATALFYYRKESRVQKMIYALKYHGHTEIGLVLGKLLGQELRKSKRFSDIDLVIPVPLHSKKKLSRGYNQCDLIAEGMAECGFTICLDNFHRTTYTETQTKRKTYGRWKNVENIFDLERPEELKGKHVLLIDDVITSGSTLEACGNAIKCHGDIKVSIAATACAE